SNNPEGPLRVITGRRHGSWLLLLLSRKRTSQSTTKCARFSTVVRCRGSLNFLAVLFFTCSVWYLSHTLIVLFKQQILDLVNDQLGRSDIVDSRLQCDRWTASSVLQKSI